MILLPPRTQRTDTLFPDTSLFLSRESFVIVLDDHQLAVADQARTRIHHHPARGRAHRLAAGPGDVDALPGRVARAVGADELPLGGPTPAEGAGSGGRRQIGRANV